MTARVLGLAVPTVLAVFSAALPARGETIARRPAGAAPYAGTATVPADHAKIFVSGVGATNPITVLVGLERALKSAGAELTDLVNVRAGLLVHDGKIATMDAWNLAWKSRFPSPAQAPTRTSLGVSALAKGAFFAEGVAAIALAARTPTGTASTTNRFIFTVGEGPHGSSAAAIVRPGAALLFSAGMLADPADTAKPERTVERFGDMATQTTSVFGKLRKALGAQGFAWDDVVYVRALLSPEPGKPDADFDGFGRAFEQSFSSRPAGTKPALTAWAAPGFAANGLLVEIEVYAAASDGKGPFARIAAATPAGTGNPGLLMTGAPTAQISSTGTVASDRALTWFSGVVGTGGGDMKAQSIAALTTLQTRAAEANVSLGDIVQLRAYPVVGDALRAQLDLWNAGYAQFFNNPAVNPHKPARTAFSVPALPGSTIIEVEVIAVSR